VVDLKFMVVFYFQIQVHGGVVVFTKEDEKRNIGYVISSYAKPVTNFKREVTCLNGWASV
jgi:hypothetical protein